MASLRFREDIEGLRGVAILLVVLAHAGVPGLSAGFIGVDVFFVISGYLITGLLTEELRATGRVDFWSFYARRARRLIPALLLMVCVVGVVVLFLVPLADQRLHLHAGLSALLWSSNIFFAWSGLDYFGAEAAHNLFLHTWSLGVEEQFYLIWPLLLAWAWRLMGGRNAWLVALVALGFAASLLMLSWDGRAAYYLMPSRLWQLALGALTHRMFAQRRLSRPVSDALLAAGLLLLAAALLVIDSGQPYPGWRALLPSLAAAVLIVAGDRGDGLGARFLAIAPLRLTGRVSYSWYLWHWPFLVIVPALGLPLWSPWATAGLVLASLTVACASYMLIERPVRRRRDRPEQTVAVAVLASVIAALGLYLLHSWSMKSTRLSDSDRRQMAVYGQIERPGIYARGCDQWYLSDELDPCEVGTWDGSAGTMVLLADSVGAQWVPALEDAARALRMRLVVMTKGACPIADLTYFYPRINRRYTECEAWRRRALEHVRGLDPQIVVIGSSQYGFEPKVLTEGTERLLSMLSAPGRTTLVLAPTPVLPFDGVRCAISLGRLVEGSVQAPRCSVPLSEVEPGTVTAALVAATRAVERSAVLYLNDLVCPDSRCQAFADGHLVYRDAQHLNARFAAGLGPELSRRIQQSVGQAAGDRWSREDAD